MLQKNTQLQLVILMEKSQKLHVSSLPRQSDLESLSAFDHRAQILGSNSPEEVAARRSRVPIPPDYEVKPASTAQHCANYGKDAFLQFLMCSIGKVLHCEPSDE